MQPRIRIIGSGMSQPDTIMTSDEMDARLGLKVGTISGISGVQQRHVSIHETAASLAADACRKALASSGLDWENIDCLVSTGATMDQALPYNAALIHAELGLNRQRTTTFDVGASCMSFLTGLDVMSHLVENGRYQNVMLVSADIATFGLNWKELRECGNFGDGAAAVVIRKSLPGEVSLIKASRSHTLSKGVRYCEIPGGGTRFHPERINTPFAPLAKFSMDGKAVFKLVSGELPTFTADLLQQAGVTLAHISTVIPHQASRLALSHMAKRLEIPASKLVDIFARFGNQVGASLPTALHHAISSGQLQRGDDALLIGTGAGVTIGGMVLTY
ncbi:MAG: 3-oxoacyl-[acyl-carrier-protein] synthase III C-terminal domain-containing protein [Formivibrio sp.]|nr:3-oxoacyl-[acyl-carrier-protein] synthase III C-terminal domain-containing protein [Formivibrio sp.]